MLPRRFLREGDAARYVAAAAAAAAGQQDRDGPVSNTDIRFSLSFLFSPTLSFNV